MVITIALGGMQRLECGDLAYPLEPSSSDCYHIYSTGGNAFLEPYMQGLTADAPETVGPQHNNLADLSSHFCLLELNASADSLDQDHNSSLSSSADDSSDVGDVPCDIGLVERLIRSHPVWFLPGIQRAGAFHLLQGKEEGNFVVRQSSQADTMAISVRLPAGKGPYIEHYLIQAAGGQLSLESSDNRFDNIPSLIAHYSQCCDELPVQLTLPRALREARNRQQLSSLALLGQEFWRYPMANPRPPDYVQQKEITSLAQHSLPSSSSSLSSFGSGNQNNATSRTPTSELGSDAIVLNLMPLSGSELVQPPSLLSTFKGSSDLLAGSPSSSAGSPAPVTTLTSSPSGVGRATRPTPPNTLNLVCTASTGPHITSNSPGQLVSPAGSISTIGDSSSRAGPLVQSSGGKTPPPPPPRWAKPASLSSSSGKPGQNFTVTTTVTFSVNHSTTPSPHVEVSCVQVMPKQPQLELEGLQTLSSHCSSTEHQSLQQAISPSSPPTSDVTLRQQAQPFAVRGKKNRASHTRQSSVKESHHYRESDILDSPTVYYRSSVADKASDYEDIWGPEVLSTFKPRSSPFSSPDDVSSRDSSSFIKRKITPDLLEQIETSKPVNCTSLTAGQKEQQQKNPSTDCTATSPAETKQGSLFYAEPADALRQTTVVPQQRLRPPQQLFPSSAGSRVQHRHSDPTQWPILSHHPGCRLLERINSTEELPTAMSASVDNLSALRGLHRNGAMPVVQLGANHPRGKPIQPPRIKPPGKIFHDTSWAVDSSWEFIGNGDEADEEGEGEKEEHERQFPTLEQQESSLEESEISSPSNKITVQDLITQKLPALRLSPEVLTLSTASSPRDGTLNTCGCNVGSRISSYDNVEGRNQQNHRGSQASDNEDTQTIFSEPWDSSCWETLLHSNSEVPGPNVEDTGCKAKAVGASCVQVTKNKNFKERLDPLLSPPWLQALHSRDVGVTGASIRAYALHLAADGSTTFAQNIDNFIACTRESRETSPQVVMRNMRQFMSGMKNYLVKHGEREFEKEVEKERFKLRANEFLNLDAILEAVMHKLVVRPLKEHLYRLFVDEYIQTGAIQLLADNIWYARSKPLHELGIRAKILPPSERSLETIVHFLQRLQEVDSPLEKLENLLASISAIFNSVKLSNQGRCITLGADDFLPLFVWVLVQSGMVAAEIEAEYMWGLLHPSLLSGEGGYYLTTLSSAVHVLKNIRACSEEQFRILRPGTTCDWQAGLLTEFHSVLKIVIPDEMQGSIITKTLPVRPNMTTRDVCKIIAHKMRITNPQDYGLFKLMDGEEMLLGDGECPQDVKGSMAQVGKHCMFAYKRMDAKIAWPRTSSPQ